MISKESFPEIRKEHQEAEQWVASQVHLKSSGQLHHISGSSANHPANSGNPWLLSVTERSPRKAERGRTCGCCFQAKSNLVILAPWCSSPEPKGKHLCACTHGSVQSLVGNLLATDLVRRNVVGKGVEIISRSPPPTLGGFYLEIMFGSHKLYPQKHSSAKRSENPYSS